MNFRAVAAPACGASPVRRLRLGLAGAALLVSACAPMPSSAPGAGSAATEQRLQAMERRLDMLERFITNVPAVPARQRPEIEANVRALELQRQQLLERYQPAHPEVREVDLSLRLLRWQLQMLDRADAPPR